jgi:integrase
MASIVPHKDGYRIHVYVKGARDSTVKRTRREAETWAKNREAELRGGPSAVLTFGEAAERWLAHKLPMLDNAANVRTVEQSIREHVLPTLAQRKMMEIERKELVDLVRGLANKGIVETAHRVGQRIRDIFDLAYNDGLIPETKRADGLSKVLPQRRKRQMPAIDPEELPKLLADIDGYHGDPITRLGLLFLAHTFTRTTELLQARHNEIRDPVTWVIPAERMKGKAEKRLLHVVPLSRQALALLKELRTYAENGSDYLLPSKVNTGGLSSNTLLFALYRLGYHGKMTGHGFRAVASTILNGSKLWSPDAIERQLHHGETDEVRAAYHRAQYLDERRNMMQWWSDYLDAALASKTAS